MSLKLMTKPFQYFMVKPDTFTFTLINHYFSVTHTYTHKNWTQKVLKTLFWTSKNYMKKSPQNKLSKFAQPYNQMTKTICI